MDPFIPMLNPALMQGGAPIRKFSRRSVNTVPPAQQRYANEEPEDYPVGNGANEENQGAQPQHEGLVQVQPEGNPQTTPLSAGLGDEELANAWAQCFAGDVGNGDGPGDIQFPIIHNIDEGSHRGMQNWENLLDKEKGRKRLLLAQAKGTGLNYDSNANRWLVGPEMVPTEEILGIPDILIIDPLILQWGEEVEQKAQGVKCMQRC